LKQLINLIPPALQLETFDESTSLAILLNFAFLKLALRLFLLATNAFFAGLIIKEIILKKHDISNAKKKVKKKQY